MCLQSLDEGQARATSSVLTRNSSEATSALRQAIAAALDSVHQALSLSAKGETLTCLPTELRFEDDLAGKTPAAGYTEAPPDAPLSERPDVRDADLAEAQLRSNVMVDSSSEQHGSSGALSTDLEQQASMPAAATPKSVKKSLRSKLPTPRAKASALRKTVQPATPGQKRRSILGNISNMLGVSSD